MQSLQTLTKHDIDDALKNWLEIRKIDKLTEIQVQAVQAGVASGESLVVCAPTSSGKTLIGEIAIFQSIRRGDRSLYLVSHKALAEQKFADFRDHFSSDTCEAAPSVALSTGERTEGDISSDILVTTYEKALSLFLDDKIMSSNLVTVADEFQIIADPNRGPTVELFCTFLQTRKIKQFLALTAGAKNPEELADWLQCKLIESHHRDVELIQEIWFNGMCRRVIFGHNSFTTDEHRTYPRDTFEVIHDLLNANKGPVLVFTETRKDAIEYAKNFCHTLDSNGLNRRQYSDRFIEHSDTPSESNIGEQLELFSDGTALSHDLVASAKRRVAIHTADLSPKERQVIERGLIDHQFDVCFATATLAAGINFPFRTVVFPKLSYDYRKSNDKRISRSDYRNMSGRAGRLGLHENGWAILLPRNPWEAKHAMSIVLPENDHIKSQLEKLHMRKAILALAALQAFECRDELRTLFTKSYFQHQQSALNASVVKSAVEALSWLNEKQFVKSESDHYSITPLGRVTASSGLLPETAFKFITMLKNSIQKLPDNLDRLDWPLIHWVCCSDEFVAPQATRFLGYPLSSRNTSGDYLNYLDSSKRKMGKMGQADSKAHRNIYAILLFLRGDSDDKITTKSGINSGQFHQAAINISWILKGLSSITKRSELSIGRSVGDHIFTLSERVRWGSPVDSLDLVKYAECEQIPKFGRQTAIKLCRNHISCAEDIARVSLDTLASILGSKTTAMELANAVTSSTSYEERGTALIAAEFEQDDEIMTES